jgi:DNA-binding MarR family transcriptional regulator
MAGEAERPRLTYLVGRLDRALRKRITEAVRPFGVSVSQYTVLSVLRTRNQWSNAQLANRAFITPQAMNEVVQALETQKLVTRRPDPSHGRIVQLTVTARGAETLRKCDAAVRALEKEMLVDFSEEARETLRSSLARCVEMLERWDESASPRRTRPPRTAPAPDPAR